MHKSNIKYPLVGIIYNWKGLKEENYLYTVEEMKKYDPQLLDDTLSNPNEFFSSQLIECANKTWEGILISNEEELYSFLTGELNDDIRDGEWYWENVLSDDLYGYKSNTLSDIMDELGIYHQQITSADNIRYPYLSECKDFEELKEALNIDVLDHIESFIAEYESLTSEERPKKINHYE